MLRSDHTGAILGFGMYHFSVYKKCFEQCTKVSIVQIIKRSLLVSLVPLGALSSVVRREKRGNIYLPACI